MKNKLKRRTVFIKNCTGDCDDFMQLYNIFRLTVRPGMSFRQFTLYYYSTKLEYIDVTFLYHENKVVGFCAAAFYSFNINGTGAIGRSATGFLENYQGKALPKWALYYKYIRYKQLHPFKKLILTVYVANPLVYSMICKYTGIVYPRGTVSANEKIMKLKEQVLTSSGLSSRESMPFAVKINFDVHKSEKLMHRIKESKDEHVKFFTSHIGSKPQVTLLVIIPVSWLNITLTAGRFIKHGFLRSGYFVRLSIPAYFFKSRNKEALKLNDLYRNNMCSPGVKYCKKTWNNTTGNCKKAFNLAIQYCKKTTRQIENANRERLRTLFTKS